MKVYKGILIAKMARVGSRSKGPDYFLKLLNEDGKELKEVLIIKKTKLWEEDPILHPYIGKKVIIRGNSIKGKHVTFNETRKFKQIEYIDIKEDKG